MNAFAGSRCSPHAHFCCDHCGGSFIIGDYEECRGYGASRGRQISAASPCCTDKLKTLLTVSRTITALEGSDETHPPAQSSKINCLALIRKLDIATPRAKTLPERNLPGQGNTAVRSSEICPGRPLAAVVSHRRQFLLCESDMAFFPFSARFHRCSWRCAPTGFHPAGL